MATPTLRRPVRAACAAAVVAIVSTIGASPLPAAADDPLNYRHVATWGTQMPRMTLEALSWPDGHTSGGIDVDWDSGEIFAIDATAKTVRIYGPDRQLRSVLKGVADARLVNPVDVAPLAGGLIAVADWGRDEIVVMNTSGLLERAISVVHPRSLVAAPNALPGVEYFVISRASGQPNGKLFGMSRNGVELEVRDNPDGYPYASGLGWVPAAPGFGTIDGFLLVAADDGHVTGAESTVWELIADSGRGIIPRGMLTGPVGIRAVTGTLRRGDEGPGLVLAGGTCADGVVQADGDDVSAIQKQELPPLLWDITDVRDLVVHPDGGLYASHGRGVALLGHAATLWDPAEYPGFLGGSRAISADAEIGILGKWPHLRRWSTDGDVREMVRAWLLGSDRESLVEKDIATVGRTHYVSVPSRDWRHEVMKIEDGNIVARWRPPDSRSPGAIAAHGNAVAVLDRAQQEVVVFRNGLEGTETSWSYVLAGQFGYVEDLAMSADRVYLADVRRSELRAYTLDGQLVDRIWTGPAPIRVDLAPDGTVYALVATKWVFAYGSDGTGLGAWPVAPAGALDRGLADLAIDADGRLYILDESGAIHVFERLLGAGGRVPPQVPPTEGTDRCAVMVDKAAQPSKVHRAERVEVVLHVTGACAGEYVTSTLPADLVIALDTSGSMAGRKLSDTRTAVMNLMLELDASLTRVGLVTFDTEATTRRALAYGTGGLSDILQDLTAGGGTSIVAGYKAAYEMFRDAAARPDAPRIIVFMSDGYGSVDGLGGLLFAAARDGITTITVGFGDSPAQELLKRMASDPSFYYEGRVGLDLDLLYEAMSHRIAREHLLVEGTIEDRLPANMAYIRGSGWPSEPAVSSDGRTLTWQLAQVLEPGMVLGYSVRPMEVGIWPTNEVAELTYVDGAGHGDSRVFPVPEVEVLHQRLFLPLIVKDDCADARLHVTLVIDASSSMRAPLEPGAPPKIDEALQAARSWVDSANLERDVMSLVMFNRTATHLATSSDRSRLHAALDAIITEEGTRIDLGLREARAAIMRQRAGGGDSMEAVVMLSDGVPAPGTRDAALLAAVELQSIGVDLYTVAVGDDADRDLLWLIAGDASRHFDVRQPGALAGVFRRLAENLRPCVPVWPRPVCRLDMWP